MSDEFDAAKLLKLGQAKLGPMLAGLTRAQVVALVEGEKAQGAAARSGVLKLLAAELDARAAQLSRESVERIAAIVHNLIAAARAKAGDAEAPKAWDELGDADRQDHVAQLEAFLSGDRPDAHTPEQIVSQGLVDALSPIFNQVEALAAEVDALSGVRERETVGPGALAEKVPVIDGKAQGKLLDQVATLAFCEGDVIRFKLDASAEDFDGVEGLRTRYRPRVVLRRDKPRVRIDNVVALDGEGRPITRVSWPRPLEGGGGREAVFPAGHIAFEL